MKKAHQETLDKIHEARNTAELAAAYDEWAERYDRDLVQGFGYTTPRVAGQMLMNALKNTAALVMDAGCGTGLVGQILHEKGYRNLHGMDYAARMLAKARDKDVYKKLFQADMTRPLEFTDNAYDAVICVGTFTHHHVGPEALPELIRITRPKGLICFTVRDSAWNEDRYRKHLLELEAQDRWELMQLVRADYLKSDGIDCKVCLYRVMA